MATARRRFFNPHNVKHGATDINTVQQITMSETWQRLAAQGDNDISDSFQAKTNLQVSGTIVLQDPVQADALLAAAGASLSWNGRAEEGGTNKLHTVTGVSFFSLNQTDSHNAVDAVTLGWNAFSPTGANPVTTGLVT